MSTLKAQVILIEATDLASGFSHVDFRVLAQKQTLHQGFVGNYPNKLSSILKISQS